MQYVEQKNARSILGKGVFLLFGLILIDQFSKIFPKTIFLNNNFAFSLPVPVVLMYLIYALVLFFMGRHIWKNFKTFSLKELTAWNLIFAGALSNIGERIVLGYVRDWIYIYNGIFNLADGYIIVGIILLLSLGKNAKLQKTSNKQILN